MNLESNGHTFRKTRYSLGPSLVELIKKSKFALQNK